MIEDSRLQISAIETTLGRILIHLNRVDAALPYLESAFAYRAKVLPESQWERFKTASILGHAYVRVGRFVRAEELLLDAFERIQLDRGPEHYRTTQALFRILDLYTRWEKKEAWQRYRGRLTESALAHPIIKANRKLWEEVIAED
ncbi:MAG: hypothetical protein H8E15_11640 [Planctomycetes bacterium]|nr:hypothetical protein [Planctomycetota bacterium]